MKKRWFVVTGLTILIAIIVYIFFNIPNPSKLDKGEYPQSSQIMDRNGKLLYEIYADKRRVVVNLDQIPKNLINATLAIEDANFYKHNGFDVRGLIRGLYRTLIKKRLQGGSTLTQQLVKNASRKDCFSKNKRSDFDYSYRNYV